MNTYINANKTRSTNNKNSPNIEDTKFVQRRYGHGQFFQMIVEEIENFKIDEIGNRRG